MHPRQIKEAFARGTNIKQLLRDSLDESENTQEIIETSYDLQSGDYVASLADPEFYNHKVSYGAAIAKALIEFTEPTSILETGVGEGTTMSFVLNALGDRATQAHGFDVSWSRMASCREWLLSEGLDVFLSVATLFNTPYAANSFDCVYTSHTVESNGGQEAAILTELYRVTSRYLVLFEPGYEFASPDAQARMDSHGYCKALAATAESLGMNVVKSELLSETHSDMNPTAITVIEKDRNAAPAIPTFACPRFGDPLVDNGDSLYSAESMRAYPKIQGIACLRPDDGIIASAYNKYLND